MHYTVEELVQLLRKNLSDGRFAHSMGVASCAKELAKRYDYDPGKAYIAGILHDCATQYGAIEILELADIVGIEVSTEDRRNPVSSLHAELGAYVAEKQYQITDKDILQAIAYHSSGGIPMSTLDKIISLADAIEPSRKGAKIDIIRKIAESNLDEAYLEKYIYYMINIMKSKYPLSMKRLQVYNYLLPEKAIG